MPSRSLSPRSVCAFVYLCTMYMFESVLLLNHPLSVCECSFFAVQIGFDVHLFAAHFRTVELKKRPSTRTLNEFQLYDKQIRLYPICTPTAAVHIDLIFLY